MKEQSNNGTLASKKHRAGQAATTHLRIVAALLFTLSLLSLLIHLSCAGKKSIFPYVFSEYVDVSDQEETLLLAYAECVYKAQRELPDSAKLHVFVFGHTVEPVYEGPPIHSRSQFNAKVASKFIHPAKELLVPFTRTELVLKRTAETPLGQNEEVWIISDGGVEDQSPGVLRSIKRSATKLAAGPLKRLVLVGVHPESRFEWIDWLGAFSSGRAVVRGLDDSDDLHPLAGEGN